GKQSSPSSATSASSNGTRSTWSRRHTSSPFGAGSASFGWRTWIDCCGTIRNSSNIGPMRASIVLTEDYPLFYSLMKRYPESLSKSWGGWKARARKWLAENKGLRKKLLSELGKGPLRLSEFEDHVRGKRSADGWTSGSDVSTALFHMQMSGDVMVVGHEGRHNIWGLSETFLPT